MPSPTLTRRALIAGAGTAIASAALAVPYVNAVRADDVCSLPVETAGERIDRLVAELALVLDAEYGGEYEVVISEGGAVSWRWAHPTPQQRLAAAKREIAAVMLMSGVDCYTAVIREPKANIAFVLAHNADGSLHRQIDIA